MSDAIEQVSECRICLADGLVDFLDLGRMPPANGFVHEPSNDEMRFPLVVSVCENCNHVQLAHTVDRNLLFSDYHYFSSSSTPIADHFAEYAETVEQMYLDDGDFVVEIGSNDGVLLENFEGYDRLGIEPAENVAAVAQENGVPTRIDFFSEELAAEVRNDHGLAKVIMANNVVGHIDDLQSLMRGVKRLLAPDGTFIVEVPYFVELYNGNEFDTIYHEHISYFSMGSFVALAELHDMVVSNVERVSVHGGSIRVHLQKSGSSNGRAPLVDDLLALEQAMGLDDLQTYHSFADEVNSYKDQIRTLLSELSSEDVTIVGYGAPAKGNVLLNYCGITDDLIEYIIDTTPAKQGTYTPGTNIPVYPPAKLHEDRPDYAFLLAWNYRDAILDKESKFRENGRFIVPISHLDII